MKMKTEDFNEIQKAINEVLIANPDCVERYNNGKFPRSEKVKDLQVRFNWDLLYCSTFDITSLSHYLNGDHVETALRRICPRVERNY